MCKGFERVQRRRVKMGIWYQCINNAFADELYEDELEGCDPSPVLQNLLAFPVGIFICIGFFIHLCQAPLSSIEGL